MEEQKQALHAHIPTMLLFAVRQVCVRAVGCVYLYVVPVTYLKEQGLETMNISDHNYVVFLLNLSEAELK